MGNQPSFQVVGEEEARASWDGWLQGFADCHFKQSFAWGEFKRAHGWRVLRAGLFEGETPLVLSQCTIKRPLGLPATLVWSNGGPVYRRGQDEASNLAMLKSFLGSLAAELGRRHRLFYQRLNPLTRTDVETQLVLRSCGFERAMAPLSTGLSTVLDLAPDLDALRRGLDKKWRNQLGSAEKGSPAFAFGQDDALLRRYHSLHEAMCDIQGLEKERLTVGQLQAMARAFGSMLEVAVCSAGGRDGAGILFWRFGGKSYIGYAATNEWGRERYLANALYWELVRRLKESGCASLDTCGIDPKKARGVTHFKRGLGGAVVEYVNEWDAASPAFLRPLANLAIALWDKQP